MIGAGEASSVTANLPRIRLKIDFDLQLDPSRPRQQEQEQYQKDHSITSFHSSGFATPPLTAGFCIWSPMAPRKLDLANVEVEG
jgi:hypothetical protein